jgi:hypothetical protein
MQVRAGALFRSMEDCSIYLGQERIEMGEPLQLQPNPYLHRPAPIPCRDKSLSSWVGMVNYLALAGERSRAPKKKTRLKKKHQDAGHEELARHAILLSQ